MAGETDIFIRPFAPSEGYAETDILLYPFEADGEEPDVFIKAGGGALTASAGGEGLVEAVKAGGGSYSPEAAASLSVLVKAAGGGRQVARAGGTKSAETSRSGGGTIAGSAGGFVGDPIAAVVVRLRARLGFMAARVRMAKVHARIRAARSPAVESDPGRVRVETAAKKPLVIDESLEKSPAVETQDSSDDHDPREEG